MPSADAEGSLRVLEACVTDPLKVVVGGLAYFDLGPQDFLTQKLRATLLGFLLRLSGDGRVQALSDLAAHAPGRGVASLFHGAGKIRSVLCCVRPERELREIRALGREESRANHGEADQRRGSKTSP